MRQPGQRLPVAQVAGAKGPDHIGPGQAAADVGIVEDVIIVAEEGEAALDYRPEGGQRGNGQQRASQDRAPSMGFHAGMSQARWRR